MSSDHLLDSEGNVVEERITTSVRGVEFQITATILNQILKINNPPPATTPRYSNVDIYTTLVPGKDVPDEQRVQLSFKPAEMPPRYRAIWHIYSRNFVQKGGSYTHFTQKDYRFFTTFINQHPLNLGQWLFKEMSYFKFVSRKNSYMPFAPLISVILFYHKIWYVGPPAHMKYCPTFGPTVLKMMKIKFGPEGSGQSQTPQRSQAPSQSVGHEAQSAPPPPPSADYDQRIRAIVDEAITYQMALIRTEFDRVRADIKLGIMDVIVAQAQVQSQLTKIKEDLDEQGAQLHSSVSVALSAASDARDKVQQLLQHFGIAGSSSSSTFGFTSVPTSSFSFPEIPTSEPSSSIPVSDPQPSSPTFSFPSPPHTFTAHPSSSPPSSPPHATPIPEPQPSPSTPATEIFPSPATPTTIPFPDPLTSPSTVATEPFPTPSPYATHSDPIDPLTAMVIWTPPLVILDPDYVDDDDDKGGEDKQ